jgi:5'-3' exonuclease
MKKKKKKVGASKDMPVLVIDGNYIAFKANFSLQGLSFNDMATGVVFGFFKEILSLMKKFKTNDLIFCWDSPVSFRKKEYPEYKAKRNLEFTDIEKKQREAMYKQINLLKKQILPSVGWWNQREQKGYEGDDMIATTVLDEPISEYIVVSNDGDLYQLLDLCSMWTGKELITEETFIEKWGIYPEKWADVKIIAGCKSDNVSGVEGCAEKTAIKYLTKTLGTKSKIYSKIKEQIDTLYKVNSPLVVLPKEGTEVFKYFTNDFNVEELKYYFLDFDFRSFLKEDNFNEWRDCFEGRF